MLLAMLNIYSIPLHAQPCMKCLPASELAQFFLLVDNNACTPSELFVCLGESSSNDRTPRARYLLLITHQCALATGLFILVSDIAQGTGCGIPYNLLDGQLLRICIEPRQNDQKNIAREDGENNLPGRCISIALDEYVG